MPSSFTKASLSVTGLKVVAVPGASAAFTSNLPVGIAPFNLSAEFATPSNFSPMSSSGDSIAPIPTARPMINMPIAPRARAHGSVAAVAIPIAVPAARTAEVNLTPTANVIMVMNANIPGPLLIIFEKPNIKFLKTSINGAALSVACIKVFRRLSIILVASFAISAIFF